MSRGIYYYHVLILAVLNFIYNSQRAEICLRNIIVIVLSIAPAEMIVKFTTLIKGERDN